MRSVCSKRTNRSSILRGAATDRSHGFSQPRAAHDLLHHAVGAGGRRGSVLGAQRTQPGRDCDQSRPHSHLLLFVLVDSHPGPGQPSVWPSAEE